MLSRQVSWNRSACGWKEKRLASEIELLVILDQERDVNLSWYVFVAACRLVVRSLD
jgi:hypothetical protein